MCPTQTTIVPTTEDVSISFLPLAHMFERVVQVRSGAAEEEERSAEEALLLNRFLPFTDGDIRRRRQGGLFPGRHQTPT